MTTSTPRSREDQGAAGNDEDNDDGQMDDAFKLEALPLTG